MNHRRNKTQVERRLGASLLGLIVPACVAIATLPCPDCSPHHRQLAAIIDPVVVAEAGADAVVTSKAFYANV